MCMTQKTEEKSVKRDYKSRMFTMIFKDKKELFRLYNAVGYNQELLQACKTLGDYSEYVYRVRGYAKEMSIEAAVDRVIAEELEEDVETIVALIEQIK